VKCEVCAESGYYYNSDSHTCDKCPNSSIPVIVGLSALLGAVILAYFLGIFLNRPPPVLKNASTQFRMFLSAVHDLGPSKMKSAVTFYQIMTSLASTFDLKPIDLSEWGDYEFIMSAFTWVEVDWSEAAYPTGCLSGGFALRLVVVAITPFIAIIAIPIMIVVIVSASVLYKVTCMNGATRDEADTSTEPNTPRRSTSGRRMSGRRMSMAWNQTIGMVKDIGTSNFRDRDEGTPKPVLKPTASASTLSVQATDKVRAGMQKLLTLLPLFLLVVFVMLPSVSRTLFASWDCVPYNIAPGTSKSFLRRATSVECEGGEHDDIVALAAILVCVWPIGMQLLFIGTLWANRKALRRGQSTAYTRALKFLAGGYKCEYFYWETVELFRRLTCSGFVILIPHDYIFARVILAISVSLPILVATAVLKPFKNPEDTALALFSQTVLLVAFGCCAILRIVNIEPSGLSSDQTNAVKTQIVGFSNAKGVFVVLGVCCLSFLVVLLGSYAYKLNQAFQKNVRKSSDAEAVKSSSWMLVGACFGGLTALVAGSAVFGAVGAIVGASTFFTIGAAAGSVAHAYCGSKFSASKHPAPGPDQAKDVADLKKDLSVVERSVA